MLYGDDLDFNEFCDDIGMEFDSDENSTCSRQKFRSLTKRLRTAGKTSTGRRKRAGIIVCFGAEETS